MKLTGEQLAGFFAGMRRQQGSAAEIVFLCIGTDRSTGDALGPLVGSALSKLGCDVVGTLEQPCDATNLRERLLSIPEGTIVVAIDACLGQPLSVGCYLTAAGPLVPGQSVRAGLPPVGHYSIAAVVNADSPKPYATLQSTSLHRVMGMADEIVNAIRHAYMI